MTTQATTSDPSFLKRVESLLSLALTAAKNAAAAVLTLQNQALTADSLDNQAAPAGVILAAIQLTPRAQNAAGISRWLVTASWRGTTSAADTVTLTLSEIQGPPTAFAGGTLEQPGGGPSSVPAVRYAKGGAVTATSANPTTEMGQQSVTTAGAAATGISCSGVAVFLPAPANNPSLVLVTITATHNLSLQALTLFAFEMP